MDQLGSLNWIVSGNGSSLYPFKWRGKFNNCQKKVVNVVGVICGNFCVGRGQYPLFQRVWCRGCYVEHPEDEFNKSGKESGGDW